MKINTPKEAADLARPHMRLEQETAVAIYINCRAEVLGEPHIVAIGSLTEVAVRPRDVFREAIRRNAAGVWLLHNHPSESTKPSEGDIKVPGCWKSVADSWTSR